MNAIKEVRERLNARNGRSAWDKGVIAYAHDMLDSLEENFTAEEIENIGFGDLKKSILNGAKNWKQYSEGGCALCYDMQIAKRLCTKSELKRTHNGVNKPNKEESWLDVQTRALYQAYSLIRTLSLY